jgi:PmbA protein
VILAASNGFTGAYAVSRHSLSVSVVAGEGVGMERDYDFTSAVYASDLEAPETIGRRAADRALKRLNPRKGGTKRLPIVFDPRVSNGMVRNLAGAISGSSISRGTSFLKDRMGEEIFAPGVTIIDDPFKPRGLRSKPFDGEGVAPVRRAVIDEGRLTTWLLDLRSARQLGLDTTGHASRGTSSPPSPAPTNLYMMPGTRSPAELIADVDEGLYVTEMMGSGGNLITGDYSRGAAGYWIERGELTYPVSEMTVAGNLSDMFRNMEPANDLEFRYGVDAPTIRVDGLTVAGR